MSSKRISDFSHMQQEASSLANLLILDHENTYIVHVWSLASELSDMLQNACIDFHVK